MDFNEKVLYQQIHPAKLVADVRARYRSLSLGYSVRGPGTEKALAIWTVHAAVHEPARGGVALLRASADVGWRMVPSRQADTHRVGHSRCGLGLWALA
jgi:hypothetical protein